MNLYKLFLYSGIFFVIIGTLIMLIGVALWTINSSSASYTRMYTAIGLMSIAFVIFIFGFEHLILSYFKKGDKQLIDLQ